MKADTIPAATLAAAIEIVNEAGLAPGRVDRLMPEGELVQLRERQTFLGKRRDTLAGELEQEKQRAADTLARVATARADLAEGRLTAAELTKLQGQVSEHDGLLATLASAQDTVDAELLEVSSTIGDQESLRAELLDIARAEPLKAQAADLVEEFIRCSTEQRATLMRLKALAVQIERDCPKAPPLAMASFMDLASRLKDGWPRQEERDGGSAERFVYWLRALLEGPGATVKPSQWPDVFHVKADA
jgi:hypothetical protein